MSEVADGILSSLEISPGVRLHIIDQRAGPPLVFVYGGCVDGDMWRDQIAPFSESYGVITYSRRYNYPNANAPIDGYSAETDAEDLRAMFRTLGLDRVFVVAHSYGALATLFLMVRHPGLIKAACLGEAPAVPLLRQIGGDGAAAGLAMFDEVQARLTDAVRAAFLESMKKHFEADAGTAGRALDKVNGLVRAKLKLKVPLRPVEALLAKAEPRPAEQAQPD